jgi:hypothetical protein
MHWLVSALYIVDVSARLAGGSANSPIDLGLGAKPGHYEQRNPSTSRPVAAAIRILRASYMPW